MNNTFEKRAGIALIVFIILLLCTMGLHPAGGNIEYLIKITGLIVGTHSIAILSIPVGWIGFWGLTRRIGTNHIGSMLAFAMASLGLVAVLLAAATNGLVLPIFLQHYKDATPETIETIKPIVRYGFAINHAFDYIYTGTFCLAILGWSISILLTGKLSKWIGWLGIAIALAVVVIAASGIAVNSLQGMRIFAGTVVIWILSAGIALYKQQDAVADRG